MEEWLRTALTIVGAVLASSGFWAWMQKRSERKDAKTRMILGLGHDRIIDLCMKYIERGSITHDEFENLHEYLYKPYLEMGGNGSAKRLMAIINNLPVHDMPLPPHRD